MKSEEIERLTFGPSDYDNRVFRIEIVALCEGNSLDVLEKTKEVLKRVIDCELAFDDPIDDWKRVLPEWFVDACSPELSKQEAERILKSENGFAILANMWSVAGFVDCFRPEQRSWYWFDGVVKDTNTLVVQVLVDGFPFSWEELEFLLRVAGAHNVENLDD